MSRATFTNRGAVANETMFLTSGTSGLFVEYDLGLVVGRLENMYVWNYGEPFLGEPRGLRCARCCPRCRIITGN